MENPIALTMGDPAGVGIEVTCTAWKKRHEHRLPPFFLIADPEHVNSLSDVPLQIIDNPNQALKYFGDALPIYEVKLNSSPIMGQPRTANGEVILFSVELAVQWAKAGDIRAIVTNPIHKASLIDCGFEYPGHTEYLAYLAGITGPSVMMLKVPGLRAIPLTGHVSIKSVPDEVSTDRIVEFGEIIYDSLIKDFGISQPRLAIAALNPHAGEGGNFGDEEEKIINPAVFKLQNMGIECFGPAPADTLFHEEARATYDAVICMYHDQALIPVKTLDFHRGVNVTLGLPFVRTSPDHGTAFDIAGTNQANPLSLISAIQTASEIAENRSKADGYK